jgi:hypothetical protein
MKGIVSSRSAVALILAGTASAPAAFADAFNSVPRRTRDVFPGSQFADPADAPLVQIPGTGVIWKITRVGGGGRDDD